MFRNDLVNREHPRFAETSRKSGVRFGLAVAAYHDKPVMNLDRFEDAADLFGALSMMHGLAHMVLSEKATHFFEHADTRDFVQRELPKVLERWYPSRRRGANKTRRK